MNDSTFTHSKQQDVVFRGNAIYWNKETLLPSGRNELTITCSRLQKVANLSGCKARDPEAMVHCLRDKSEAEILAINQVGKMVWLGESGDQDLGLSVLNTGTS